MVLYVGPLARQGGSLKHSRATQQHPAPATQSINYCCTGMLGYCCCSVQPQVHINTSIDKAVASWELAQQDVCNCGQLVCGTATADASDNSDGVPKFLAAVKIRSSPSLEVINISAINKPIDQSINHSIMNRPITNQSINQWCQPM